MRRWTLAFVLASFGCAGPPSFAPPQPPDPALVEAVPEGWAAGRDEVSAACDSARTEVDARIARHKLDSAEQALGRTLDACGLGPGLYWRYGWIERERGHLDAATRALSRELLMPDAEAAAGAQLRALLPHIRRSTRRRVARIGRTMETGVYTNEGFTTEALVDLRCHGKPATLWVIGHDRDPLATTYVVMCGGVRRTIYAKL